MSSTTSGLDSGQLTATTITTRRGIDVEVRSGGPEGGVPVVFMHGFTGPLGGEPALLRLAETGYRVHAPLWPGYSEAGGEDRIDDMLDFALHGADVVDALGLGPAQGAPAPHLVGHSMGAMIAAEMVALAPFAYASVVLAAPLGLWLDEHPVPDIYVLLPYEYPPLLFHDAEAGTALLAGGGVDFAEAGAIQRFLIGNSRRLGTAGKILFPIPNRRLSKRLYRITNPVLLLWGDDDRLLAAPYREAWAAALPHAQQATIEAAGHMAPYEQPDAVAAAIDAFLRT